jgi:hypothetical protein
MFNIAHNYLFGFEASIVRTLAALATSVAIQPLE